MSANGKSNGEGLRKAVGLRIVQARLRRGWSQASLARRLEVSRERLGGWERGSSAPSLEVLARLSDVLEVTCEELVRGKVPVPQIPPANRSEAARYLNAFLQTIRPWLQPPKKEEK